MRKLHGSVAKLVNDLLDVRLVPFWGDGENRDYFDGCLRDETQLIRSYRYVLRQSVRHGICRECHCRERLISHLHLVDDFPVHSSFHDSFIIRVNRR